MSKGVKLPLSQLIVGLTIKLPLSWTNHPFVFNQFEIETGAQIELIKSLNISYVYLIAGKELITTTAAQPVATVVEQSAEDYAKEQLSSLRKSLRISQQRFQKCGVECRTAFSKMSAEPEGAYRAAATLVESLMDHIKETPIPCLALVNSGEDSAITEHGVSVAVLSMMLGHLLDCTNSELRDMAMGALFHDLGKLKVPDVIRRKKSNLSDHEVNFLKMHPKFGYDMMTKQNLFPEAVLDIVLHHHEWADGSGYPDGLKGSAIALSTQIVALANDFELLLKGGEGRSPQVALGYLFKKRVGKHAPSLISALVKVLGIYPPGTLVLLSNAQVAKVLVTTPLVKQPHVLACDENGENTTLRYLIKENISIERVVKIDELSKTALTKLDPSADISFYFSPL
ncbi:phosphohydrolase [Shewanella sp. Choline-02u-19]|uniref:HD-GYP domain-containing protein n=1 Tax=unclassified Shewanella TaxID=196818 RepID=UPI000C34A27F|nr:MULTISPECIES: HD domain-containing phosphohydrolase [unclassified Shewanella]PKH55864.1 phosphohydrolase [Shewanella sp. Bg11-22]PKI27227.1 phosphohydrolase [Shewanella sp. Choline-02u-19]